MWVVSSVLDTVRSTSTPKPATETYYNGILEGYRQNSLPVHALKAAWQHCVQEVERETAQIDRKPSAYMKRKTEKKHER